MSSGCRFWIEILILNAITLFLLFLLASLPSGWFWRMNNAQQRADSTTLVMVQMLFLFVETTSQNII